MNTSKNLISWLPVKGQVLIADLKNGWKFYSVILAAILVAVNAGFASLPIEWVEQLPENAQSFINAALGVCVILTRFINQTNQYLGDVDHE